MPFEDTLLRRAHMQRARRARELGAVPEHRFPVRSEESADVYIRDNGLFDDQTGLELIGFAVIGMMKAGGP